MSKHKTSKTNVEMLKRLADYIIARLKENGLTIQRYDAYSTNSIYLKLDYGVCNSIRISDHKGKRNLSYRYNILSCCPYAVKSKDEHDYIRFYFPVKDADMLIRKIIFDRAAKMNMYGLKNYRAYMKINKFEGSKRKGFWQQARVI